MTAAPAAPLTAALALTVTVRAGLTTGAPATRLTTALVLNASVADGRATCGVPDGMASKPPAVSSTE